MGTGPARSDSLESRPSVPADLRRLLVVAVAVTAATTACAHTYTATPVQVAGAVVAGSAAGGARTTEFLARRDDAITVRLVYPLRKNVHVEWHPAAPADVTAVSAVPAVALGRPDLMHNAAFVLLDGPPGLGLTRAGVIATIAAIVPVTIGSWLVASSAACDSELCAAVRTTGASWVAVGGVACVTGVVLTAIGQAARRALEHELK